MPQTALRHFQEDIQRARALVRHAADLACPSDAERLLRDDVLRSAWMFAVGALDAYFCDAYTDLVATTINAQQRQPAPAVTLPDFFLNIRVPVRAVLQHYSANTNWRWRMAARKLMERENVLSLKTIQDLFNKFLANKQHFFQDLLPTWIQAPTAKKRLFGITAKQFLALPATPAQPREAAIKSARQVLERRFHKVFQRRHDCIHSCDRPRVSPQPIGSHGSALKVIEDVEFLVTNCDAHLEIEFRQFLVQIGCTNATITSVGY